MESSPEKSLRGDLALQSEDSFGFDSLQLNAYSHRIELMGIDLNSNGFWTSSRSARPFGISLGMIVAFMLSGCEVLRDVGDVTGAVVEGVGSIVDEDFGKGLGKLVSTPLTAPADYADERERIHQENDKKEREIKSEMLTVQKTIRDLQQMIDDIRERTDTLISASADLKRQIAEHQATLDEQRRLRIELRNQKQTLLADISAKKDTIDRLRLDHTLAAYVKAREEQGLEDPVDKQMKRLQSLSDEALRIPLP